MFNHSLKMWRIAVLALCALAFIAPLTAAQDSAGTSLRFYGNGHSGIDRVLFDLHTTPRLNVGGDFTIEFFMKANPGENTSGDCGDGWIYNNIIIDRDIYNQGSYGDYGIALSGSQGVLVFGVAQENGTYGEICGTTDVTDGEWHHIAFTRHETGLIELYVDGVLDAWTDAAVGDVSYGIGRETIWAFDPFLVVGAEKHDAGPEYPSYNGWMDELRISDIARYTEDFTAPTEPFVTDENTVGLYHFDEGDGDIITDSSGLENHGVRSFGGTPAGPEWSAETPLTVPASEATETPSA